MGDLSLRKLSYPQTPIEPARLGANGSNGANGGYEFPRGFGENVGAPRIGAPQESYINAQLADVRRFIGDYNGSGDLNPYSVTGEQGQNLYVKEGEKSQKQYATKLQNPQEIGKTILDTQFGGDTTKAMEFLLENQLV